ncbi:MAG: VOC family protein [bacterium]
MKVLHSLNLIVLLCLLLMLGLNRVQAQDGAAAEPEPAVAGELSGRELAAGMPGMLEGAMIRVDIPSNDLEESREFYSEVFGWEISDNEETGGKILNWVDPAGNTGGITSFVAPGEGRGVVIYLYSDDIDESFKRINRAGGRSIDFTMEIEGGRATVGLFNDPQGNMLGLISPNG